MTERTSKNPQPWWLTTRFRSPLDSLAIMSNSFFDNPVARTFNRLAVGLTTVPVLGGIVGRNLVEIR